MSWDEDEVHRWLARAKRPRSFVGSTGHDAAVTARPKAALVSCLDQCIEGVHTPLDVAPADFGRKAANRALSDLAATAAMPRGVLLGLSAPAARETRWMHAVISGVRRAAEAVGAELWGGDLAAAPGPARVCVTALGELTRPGKPVGRDRARPGQVVVLTGPVGGSLAGRHLRFAPRVAAGRRLAAAGCTALMDVSDGLAWDLHRLARASGVRIDLTEVPVHRDARRVARGGSHSASWHALHDGEDHELIATLSAAAARRELEAAARNGETWTIVGRVREGSGLHLAGQAADGAPRRWAPAEGGFRHGR